MLVHAISSVMTFCMGNFDLLKTVHMTDGPVWVKGHDRCNFGLIYLNTFMNLPQFFASKKYAVLIFPQFPQYFPQFPR
jgi:hypothetical protein